MAGRIKKLSWILLLTGVLCLCFDKNSVANAKTFMTPYLVEQAHGKAPDITAYVTGGQMSKKASFSGTIGDALQLLQAEASVSL